MYTSGLSVHVYVTSNGPCTQLLCTWVCQVGIQIRDGQNENSVFFFNLCLNMLNRLTLHFWNSFIQVSDRKVMNTKVQENHPFIATSSWPMLVIIPTQLQTDNCSSFKASPAGIFNSTLKWCRNFDVEKALKRIFWR